MACVTGFMFLKYGTVTVRLPHRYYCLKTPTKLVPSWVVYAILSRSCLIFGGFLHCLLCSDFTLNPTSVGYRIERRGGEKEYQKPRAEGRVGAFSRYVKYADCMR